MYAALDRIFAEIEDRDEENGVNIYLRLSRVNVTLDRIFYWNEMNGQNGIKRR